MTLAGKFFQSIQHLGSSDIDCDLLVFALGVAHSGHTILLRAGLHFLPITFLDRKTMKLFPKQRNMFLITILPKVHFEVQTFPSLLATVMPRALLLSLSCSPPLDTFAVNEEYISLDCFYSLKKRG